MPSDAPALDWDSVSTASQASPNAVKPAAPSEWDAVSTAAKVAPGPEFTPVSYINRTDPEAHWRKIYAEEYTPEQHRALSSVDYISRDPEEDRKRAVNQSFVADKLGLSGAAVSSNWSAIKTQFAKTEMNIDDPNLSDKSLHGFIQARLTPEPLRPVGSEEGQGEVKPWTWQDTLRSDVHQIAKNVGNFFEGFSHSAIDKIPDPPKDLPDFALPGMMFSPAVTAGVWTGAVKPLLSFATSPLGLATAEGGTLLEGASKTMPLAKKALGTMTGLFTAWMGYGAYKATPEALKAMRDPNASTQEKVAAASGPISQAIMASLGALGTAFSFMGEKAPAVADGLKGKTPGEAAEVLRKEAVTATPEQADALHQAATHFEEVSAYERGPEAWEAAAHPQERIVAAAVKTADGKVSEGTAHEEIKAELKGEAATEEKTDPIAGSTEGFVTSSGRFVTRQEAAEISQVTGQSKLDVPAGQSHELHSHEVDMGPRSTMGRTSLKNAYGELERAAYGFPEATPTEQRSMAESWSRSEDVLKKNAEAGAQLADRLKKNPNLGLTDDQSALLLRHKVGLENALNEARDIAFDPNASPQLREEGQRQMKELSQSLLDLVDAVHERGSEWGREGRWRQALAREDYSFASQETLARVAKGGQELTPEEQTKLRDQTDRIKELEAKLAAARSAPPVARTEAVEDAVREMAKPPKAPRIVKAAEAVRDKLHARALESRKFLSGKLLSPTPEDLYHVSVIAADHIYSTGLDFAKWSASMVADLGEKVRPLLAEAWESGKKLFHAENRSALIADLAGKTAEERQKSLPAVAQELTRAQIEQGAKDREKIVDSVHGDIEKAMPGISKREVMDAISGYGKFKPLTHDQVTDQLRDIKGQLQQVAKLEDMAAGEAPKKTGVERKTPSDEERRLIQQVEEEKKKGGYNVTDPDKQLRTALDTVKTRLTNQIADLEKQIATGERIVNERRPSPSDNEVEILKARRDELKEQFDGIFGRKELSDVQRLNIFKAYANRRVLELEELKRSYEDGSYQPPTKRPPVVKDAEGMKAEKQLERLKQEVAAQRIRWEEDRQPGWQKAARKTADVSRFLALTGYHTLGKLLSFSVARYAEPLATTPLGQILRKVLPESIAERANMEFGVFHDAEGKAVGSEYKALARFYAEATEHGAEEFWQTITTGKSDTEALYGEKHFNTRPLDWTDAPGIIHKAEKSILKRSAYAMNRERLYNWAIANGLDVTNDEVKGALNLQSFAEANRTILQENNVLARAFNSAERVVMSWASDRPTVQKQMIAIRYLFDAVVTRGIVKTPANFMMQNLFERSPIGLARAMGQTGWEWNQVRIHGVSALTNVEANMIARLWKLGAVGSAMFVWGAIDATKDPKDRIFGGFYQPGEKRGDDDVLWGRVRIGNRQLPPYATEALAVMGQMGSTFSRVAFSKMSNKDKQQKGYIAGTMASILALASSAPIVNPMTRVSHNLESGHADQVLYEEIANLLTPAFNQNLAQDLDGKSRAPTDLKEHLELGIPGLRSNVPETKAQKKRDIRDRLKK